jgi:hypothetical protein
MSRDLPIRIGRYLCAACSREMHGVFRKAKCTMYSAKRFIRASVSDSPLPELRRVSQPPPAFGPC